MIPYEAYTGQKPGLSYLRTFGCAVYTHMHRAQRGPGKFKPRTHNCILLGYVEGTTTIYKLFDVKKKVILNSGSVVFDESQFPGTELQA